MMSEEQHMIIKEFQQGVNELTCSLKEAKEECRHREAEWRSLEERRVQLIQAEQELTSQNSHSKSTLERQNADLQYLEQAYRDAETDLERQQQRLEELCYQLEEERSVLALMQNNLVALKETLMFAGDTSHFKYLLNEAENLVQSLSKEIEDMSCEDR